MKIQTHKPKVRGSNPLLATKKIKELEENSDPLFILPKKAVPNLIPNLAQYIQVLCRSCRLLDGFDARSQAAASGATGSKEATVKLIALIHAGIRHVINLMEPDERDFSGHRFVPYDDVMVSIAAKMDISVTFDHG